MSSTDTPITIKKYANRRLYNTASSSYVTLDHLCRMVKDNQDFVVYDAKTGEDITRSVLTQIIVEEETKSGQSLLPIGFLREVIGFYGDSLGGVLPRYLEHSMRAFHRNEAQMRQYMQNALDGLFPFNPIEEISKQNMAFIEGAMNMFKPFYGQPGEGNGAAPTNGAAGTDESHGADQPPIPTAEELKALQLRLNTLQSQIESLSKKKQP
jgi:polyhydroxyalkanoate synthesis repressor PhaR